MSVTARSALPDIESEITNQIIIHGQNHISVANGYHDLGDHQVSLQDIKSAISSFNKALEIRKNLLPANDEVIVDTEYILSSLYALENQKDDEFLQNFKTQIRSNRESLDANRATTQTHSDVLSYDFARNHRNNIDSTFVYCDMAQEAVLTGNFREGSRLYLRAINLRRKKYGADHEAVATVLIKYAEMLNLQGSHDKARTVLEESLSVYVKNYGHKHTVVADTLNKLGAVLIRLNELREAEPLLLEAVDLLRSYYGEAHPMVASTLNNLGEVYREKGDYIEAIAYHEAAIESFQRSVGDDHPGTINARGNLGLTLRRQARVGMQKSDELLQQAVDYMHAHKVDPSHPWFVKFETEQVLGQAQKLGAQGNTEQSIVLYDKLLGKALNHGSDGASKIRAADIQMVMEGRLHSLLEHAKKQCSLGRFENAAELFDRCLQSPRSTLGDTHRLIVDALLAQARNVFLKGDYDQAQTAMLDILQSRIDVYGPEHILVAEAAVDAADVKLVLALYDEAETLLAQANKILELAIQNEPEALLTASSWPVALYARSLLILTRLQEARGNYQNAIIVLSSVETLCEKSFQKDHPITADYLRCKSLLALTLGTLDEATSIATQALTMYRVCYGSMHPDIAFMTQHLGIIALLMGRLGEAAEHLETSHNMFAQHLPLSHPYLLTSHFWRGRLCAELGRYEDAREHILFCWRAREELYSADHPATIEARMGLIQLAILTAIPDDENVEICKSLLVEKLGVSVSSHALGLQCAVFAAAYALMKGLLQQALAYFSDVKERCSALITEFNTSSHYLMCDVLLGLANVHRCLGDFQTAKLYTRDAGLAVCSVLGEYNSKVAECLFAMAELSKARGKFRDARVLYSRCMTMRVHLLGANHPLVGEVYRGAADNLRLPGYYEHAHPACEKAYTLQISVYGANSIAVALTQVTRAQILYETGETKQALNYLQEALVIIKDILGEGNFHYMNVMLEIGECLTYQNHFNDSLMLYSSLYQRVSEVFGENSYFLLIMSSRFCYSLICLGKTADALALLCNTIQPSLDEMLGRTHPVAVNARGRIGLAINELNNKKKSGSAIMSACLRFFDEYGQFSYAANHPWILELGGFTDAILSARAPSALDVSALAPWVVTTGEDHDFKEQPKNEAVASTSASGDSWGTVSFGQDTVNFQKTFNRFPDLMNALSSAKIQLSSGIKSIPDVDLSDQYLDSQNLQAIMSDLDQRRSDIILREQERKREETRLSEEYQLERERLEAALVREATVAHQISLVEEASDLLPEVKIDAEKIVMSNKGEVLENISVPAINEYGATIPTGADDSSLGENLLPENSSVVDKAADGIVVPSTHLPVETMAAPSLSLAEKKRLETLEEDSKRFQEQLAKLTAELEEKNLLLKAHEEAKQVSSATPRTIKRNKVLDAALFLFNRASELLNQGFFVKSLPLFQECILVRHSHAPETELEAQALFAYAEALRGACQWTLAMQSYQQCQTLRVMCHGEQSVLVSDVLFGIGDTFFDQGRYREAFEKYNEGAHMRRTLLEQADPLMGFAFCKQALVSLRLGKFAEASSFVDRGYSNLQKAYGTRQVGLSDAMYVKAELLRAQGKYKEVKPYLEQALYLRKQFLSDQHPKVAELLISLSQFLFEQGALVESHDKLMLAKEMLSTFHCSDDNVNVDSNPLPRYDHYVYVDIFIKEAAALRLTSKFIDAEQVLINALDICRRYRVNLGEHYDELLEVNTNQPTFQICEILLALADIDIALGRYADGREKLQEVATSCHLLFGENVSHPLLAQRLLLLGDLERQYGSYDEAREYFESSLHMRRQMYGPDHIMVLYSQKGYGDWQKDTQSVDKALQLFRRIIQAAKKLGVDNQPEFIGILVSYADGLWRAKYLTEAEATINEVLQLCQLYFPEVSNHLWILECQKIKIWVGIDRSNADLDVASTSSESLHNPTIAQGINQSGDVAVDILDEAVGDDETLTQTLGNDGRTIDESLAQLESIDDVPVDGNTIGITRDSSGVPQFYNEGFIAARTALYQLLSQWQALFPAVIKHPALISLKGDIGIALKLESDARDKFLGKLTQNERKLFLLSEAGGDESSMPDEADTSAAKSKAKPGREEIGNAMNSLLRYPLHAQHMQIEKFRKHYSTMADEDKPDELAMANMILRKGQHMLLQSQYAEANIQFDDALGLSVEILTPVRACSNGVVAEILFGKAECQRWLASYDLSRRLYEQSLSIFRRLSSGEDTLDIAKVQFGLGELFRMEGLGLDALLVHESTIDCRRAFLPAKLNSLLILESMVALVNCHLDMGKFDQASSMIEKAFTAYGTVLDIEREITWIDLQLCTGRLKFCVGDYKEALELFDNVHVKRTALFGEESAQVAEVLFFKSAMMLVTGKLTSARKLIYASMKTRIKLFGRNSKAFGKSAQDGEALLELLDLASESISSGIAKRLLSDQRNKNGNSDGAAFALKQPALAGNDVLEDCEEDSEVSVAIPGFDNNSFSGETQSQQSVISPFKPGANSSNDDNNPAFIFRGMAVTNHPIIVETLSLRGEICLASGIMSEGKEMLKSAHEMIKRLSNGKINHLFAMTSFSIANLSITLGHLKDALAQHRVVMDYRLRLFGEDHPIRGDSLLALSVVKCLLGEYDDAATHADIGVNIARKQFGEHHPRYADMLTQQGQVCRMVGRYQEALSLYSTALQIYKKYFDDFHPSVATCILYLGEVSVDLSNYDAAYSFIEQALSLRTMVLGDDHPLTALCMRYLADVMRYKGKILDVKGALEQCIICQRDKLGKDHFETLTTLVNLGYNYLETSMFDIARPIFVRANQLLRRALGPNHPLIAYGMAGLAETLKFEGKLIESRSLHEQALALLRKQFADSHSSVAKSLYYLADLDLFVGSYDDAMRGFDNSLAINRQVYSQVHSDIALALQGLGKTLYVRGKYTEARFSHEKALAMRKTLFGVEHPSIGESNFHLANLFKSQGKLEQAAALFERALEMLRAAYGPRHPMVANVLHALGEVTVYLGRHEIGSGLLHDAYHIRNAVFGNYEPHPDIAESYFGIGEVLRLRGFYDFIQEDTSIAASSLAEQEKQLKELKEMQTSKELLAAEESSIRESQAGQPEEKLIPTEDRSLSVNSQRNREAADSLSFVLSETVDGKYEMTTPIAAGDDDISVIDDESVASIMMSQIDKIQNNITADKEDNLPAVDEFAMALPVHQKALFWRLHIFGEEHFLTIQSHLAIAQCLLQLGQYAKAQDRYVKVLTNTRRVFGDAHPETVLAMLSLAESLRAMSKIFPTKEDAEKASSNLSTTGFRQSGPTLVEHLSSIFGPNDHLQRAWPPDVSPHVASIARGKNLAPGPIHPKLYKKFKGELPQSAGGYMGYAFPTSKKLLRTNVFGATRPAPVKFEDASWLCDSASNLHKVCLGDGDHPIMASLLFTKAEIFKARRRPDLALPLHEQALAMRRHLFHGQHPTVALSLNAIGELYRVEGKFYKSQPLLEKALEIYNQHFKGFHPMIAEIENNLAMLLYGLGKFSESQALYKASLQLREKLLGPCHIAVAQTLNNFGGLLHASGKFSEAEMYYRRAIAIKRKSFGPRHPDVASCRQNLGLALKAQGKFEEARELFNGAYLDQLRVLGREHPDVASTLNNLASVLAGLGRLMEARNMYFDVISLKRQIYGVDHPSVASSLNNLAGLMFKMGEIEDAKDLYEESLAIRKQQFGDNHIAVAESLNNIGLVLFAQGSYLDAQPQYERALAIKIATFGEVNLSCASSMNNIGGVLHKRGLFEEAESYYLRSLDIRRSLLGNGHQDVLSTLENLRVLEIDRQNVIRSGSSSRPGTSNNEKTAAAAAVEDQEFFGVPNFQEMALDDGFVVEDGRDIVGAFDVVEAYRNS